MKREDVVELVDTLVQDYLVGVGDGSVRTKTGVYDFVQRRLDEERVRIGRAVQARIRKIAADLGTNTAGFETPALLDQVLEEIRIT